jgi:valyl-tRNA synthetase
LDSATQCFARYQKALDENEFSSALTHAEQFFWNDFCDNYLELIKNQLFNPQEYDAETVQATQWTLYQVGLRILQLYAPYMPHITESIYQALYKKHEKADSIHQTQFSRVQKPYQFTQSAQAGQAIIAIATLVRKLKTEKQLSLKTPLETLAIIVSNKDQLTSLHANEQIIRGVTQAQKITVQQGTLEHSLLEEKDSVWHATIGI